MSNFEIMSLTSACLGDEMCNAAIASACARAGGIGIVDIEYARDIKRLESMLRNLLAETSGRVGIKCGAWQTELYASLFQALAANGRKNYVVLVPEYFTGQKEASLKQAIARLGPHNLTIAVEAISTEEAQMAQNLGADLIIAKGHESGGRIGEETAFVLLQRLLKEVNLPVYVQGGIGLNSAAACSVAGASGVVLDSQLLLSCESPLSTELKAHLAHVDGSHTIVLGSSTGQAYRLFSRPGLPIIEELAKKSELPLNQWQQLLSAKLIGGGNQNSFQDCPWFVGQDAALAISLAETYRTVSGIMQAIWKSIEENTDNAAKLKILADGSPLARSHGTRYPLVQGAMTRVSDCADFALKVAEAGALPFLALALMRGEEVEKLLKETKEKLSAAGNNLPWGVGILGFVPQQLRNEQLAAVKKYRPQFALIAGGRPDQAKELEDEGIHTYLHVPSPVLLKSFIEMGARRFIFEGRECGGHVGPRSSFVLWESMIDTLLSAISSKEEASKYHIIFAGGIHDHISSAMVATMSAPLGKIGVNIGALMGTAYLFTQEAVSSGAIVKKFQEAAIACDKTVLLETGPGHAIRCINSPYKVTFDDHRKQLEALKKGKDEIREELELMNLGRLRIASKGLSRNQDAKSGESNLAAVPEPKQWQDGMYMIGQVASMHKQVLTIEQLHQIVCQKGTNHLVEFAENQARKKDKQTSHKKNEDIAIVGMSCLFAKANGLDSYWHNILNKVDAVEEIPKTHWDWTSFYDPDPLARDKIYSKWGGFLKDLAFNPARYGIPPSSLATIDPMHPLLLEVTRAALDDAGYKVRPFPKEKTSFILANAGHGPITAWYGLRTMLDWKLQNIAPAIREQLQTELPEWTEDTFPGFLGNVAAGRVANRFDLAGINCCVDAACASSLAALYVGVHELRKGSSEIALVAAVDTHNQPGDYLSFSKVHALSPSGKCRTFDATADGIAISEGIGVVVLKRLADAERDGDRIYAVIKGIAGSSDGRDLSLTAPRPAGQMLALTRAYEDAGISPDTISLVETHGTGTVAGDKAELESLQKVFQAAGAKKQSCAVGSVKTMIGHTKAAAGIASIIKIAKALHHKVLPATMGVTTPNPACKFDNSPFYINSELRPWIKPQAELDVPRRAGVSAFGFGGTNFHAVLEEYQHSQVASTRAQEPASYAWDSELFLLKANSHNDLLKTMDRLIKDAEVCLSKSVRSSGTPQEIDAEIPYLALMAHATYLRWLEASASKTRLPELQDNKQYNLSIIATSLADLLDKLRTCRKELSDSQKSDYKDPKGIYFAVVSRGKKERIAFLFPGQGSQKINMLKELSLTFPEIRQTFENANKVLSACFENPLSSYVYPKPTFSKEDESKQEKALTDTHIAQPAIAAADLALRQLLATFAITPDVVAGHSFGEYVALCAAGSLSPEELFVLSEQRGKMLSQNGNTRGSMAACSAAVDTVSHLVAEIPGVTIANINAPNQCVLSGEEGVIEKAVAILSDNKISARTISVSAAFHSPHMSYAKEKLEQALNKVHLSKPSLPVYSNTDALPHPDSPQSIASRLVEHLLKPVQFVKEIESIYDSGVGIFVEVGPGTVLTGLVDSILEGKPHLAISCDRPGRNGITQLHHLLGQLAARGINLKAERLYACRFQNSSFSSFLTSPEKFLQDEVASSLKPKRMLYRINSAVIEALSLKGNQETAMPTPVKTSQEPSSQAVPAPEAAARNVATSAVTQVTPGNGNGQIQQNTVQPIKAMPLAQPVLANTPQANVDQVMINFQQSMLQMTNSFLETQQNVMLAYLRSKQGLPVELLQNPGINNGAALLNTVESLRQNAPIIAPGSQSPVQASVVEASSKVQSELVPTPVVASNSDSSPPPQTSLSKDQLVSKFLEIVSDRTGYPPDMLDLNLDMEADLGIDSIKRVEILSNFRKLLPESVQSGMESGIEKLAGIKTLQGIIDWIVSTVASGQAPVAAGSVPLGTTSTGATVASTISAVAKSHVSRGQVKTSDLALGSLPAFTSSKIVLITDDEGGVATSLSAQLKQNNNQVVILRHRTDSENGSALENHTYSCDLSDPESVRKVIDTIEQSHGQIGGLIHLLALGASRKSNIGDDALDVRSLFLLAKYLEPQLHGQGNSIPGQMSFVLSASSLGGSFGVEQVATDYLLQAGIVGVTKSISREWKNTYVKAIDFSDKANPDEVAGHILAELSSQDNRMEIGYIGNRRVGLDIFESSLTKDGNGKPSGLELDSSSVILVTGGARGITAELALELAEKYKPNMIVVGRSPRPERAESPETAQLSSPRDLKAKIMEMLKSEGKQVNIAEVESIYSRLIRDREIRTNLARLEQSGATVRYFALDVQDDAAFANLIDSLYEMFGNIDGVIQGAGVIEDSFIKDKKPESFDRVFFTKSKSALTLSRRLHLDSLKFLVFLSSVVGRTGNVGQCDYVAANEVLNKLALSLDKRTPARVISIGWGPWRAGMAKPELEQLFASYGWSMIDPESGRKAFDDELLIGHKGEVEVLLVGMTDAPTFDMSGNGKPDNNGNGHHETSALLTHPGKNGKSSASGARLSYSDQSLIKPGYAEFLLTLDPNFDLYLKDHTMDTIPVLPMAMVLELLCEAALNLYPGWHIARIHNLQIPSGVVIDNGTKPVAVVAREQSRTDSSVFVKVSLESNPINKRIYFHAVLELTQAPEIASAEIPIPYSPDSIDEPRSELPTPAHIYSKWLFHGPLFQGITKVRAMGINGIVGEVSSSSPSECLVKTNGDPWIIDPILFDSSMQLGGSWTRAYVEFTCLPTGFKTLHLFQPITNDKYVVRVVMPLEIPDNILRCQLGMWTLDGKPVLWIEDLGGIGSKSLNRLSQNPRELRSSK